MSGIQLLGGVLQVIVRLVPDSEDLDHLAFRTDFNCCVNGSKNAPMDAKAPLQMPD